MRQATILLTAISSLLLLAACSKPTPEQQAINTVLESYEGLLQGDYETFLNNRAGMDSIPDSYREQLLVSYKQFIAQQRKAHEDIVELQPFGFMHCGDTMRTTKSSMPTAPKKKSSSP